MGGCYTATVKDWVAAEKIELKQYDVKVDFRNDFGDNAQWLSIKETSKAVKAIAKRAQQAVEEITGAAQSSIDAFKKIFGPIEFRISAQSPCDNCWGKNQGELNGVTYIDMGMGGYFDTSSKGGAWWVAHEIGHNLTSEYHYPDTNFATSTGPVKIRTLIYPQAGAHAPDDLNELTGDIVSAWAFDAYQPGRTALAFSNQANAWMSDAISKILQISTP